MGGFCNFRLNYLEVSGKICLFILNSYLDVNHSIKSCCGIVKLNTKEDMTNVLSLTGFDSNGNPCDCIDDNGTIWIYLGKRYGADKWGGIPKDA